MEIGRVFGNVVATIKHPFFDGHKLMLVDDIGAHAPVDGYETLPYYANSGQVPRGVA